MYDPRLGRFLSMDSKSGKHPFLSPYHFTSNNPIKFVDYDGNDYGVYVNHDTKTITIKATYVSTSKDVEEATSAANKWVRQNGRYQYVIGKGKQALAYDVKFELTVKDASKMDNPDNDAEYAVRDMAVHDDKTGEVNSYQVVPLGDPGLRGNYGIAADDQSNKVKGVSSILVAKGFQEKQRTGAHEIGHTLGIGHWFKGLMKSGRTRRKDEVYITKGMIGQILKVAGVGQGTQSTTDYEVEPTNGEDVAKQHPEGEKSAPANFNSGKVKKVKKKKK